MVAMPIPVDYNTNNSLNHLKKTYQSEHVTAWVLADPFAQKHESFSSASEAALPIDSVAREELISKWVQAAMAFAIVHFEDNDDVLIATVRGIQGPWGYGSSPNKAIDDLKSVLHGWIELKLEDGDDDIPIISGVNVYPS